MELSIRKGFYFLLKFKLKRRAGMALPIFLSPCVQDVAAWLYHHPSGHTDVALAVGLGMTSRGDQSPADCPMLPTAAIEGERLVAFPLVPLALGLQTGSTLAARSSRELLGFSM